MTALAPRPSYARFEAYEPGRRPVRIDLSDNTNQAGVPPSVRRLLEGAASSLVTRYPSVYGADLKRALATFAGVPEDAIVTGCGSDDVLDSAVRAFTEPGDRLAYPWPTFSMLPHLALMNGLEPAPVPLGDLDALAGARARVTYLCTPNNPTGGATPRADVLALAARTEGLVIVDEAYVDYGGESVVRDAAAAERVLVTRTMSKAFGLAGLRVGWGVGAPSLVRAVEKSRGPYKVGGLAERAAVLALTEDLGWVRARVAEVLAERARALEALRAAGLAPWASDANFLFVPVRSAKAAAEAFHARGVGVRPFGPDPEAVRISIGTREQMDEVLAIARDLSEELGGRP